MKNIIERPIVPYNPSANGIAQKEKYYLYAPIASTSHAGMALFDASDFEIKDQKVFISQDVKDGFTQEITDQLTPIAKVVGMLFVYDPEYPESDEHAVGKVPKLERAVAQHDSAIDGLGTRITNVENEINTANTGIKARLDKAEGDIASIPGAREAYVSEQLTAFETNKLNPAVSAVDAKAGKNAEDIATQTGRIDTLYSTTTTLTEGLAATNKVIDNTNETVAGHATRIGKAEGDISLLDGRITNNEDALKTAVKQISLSVDSQTFKIYAEIKDAAGTLIYKSNEIDLPLEELIVDMEFDSENRELVLTLKNGNTLSIGVDQMFRGIHVGLDGTADNEVLSASTGPMITQAIAEAVKNRVTTNGLERALSDYVKSEVLKNYVKSEVLDNYVTDQELENILAGFQPSGSGGGSGGNVSSELNDVLNEVFLTNGTHRLKYLLDETAAYCAGIGKATVTDIVVGSKVKGLPVIGISENAFENCSVMITSVEIPKTITTIDVYAFANNKNLKTLYIHKGVTNIKASAFAGVTLSEIYYGGTQAEWQAIIIGSGNTALTDVTPTFGWKG